MNGVGFRDPTLSRRGGVGWGEGVVWPSRVRSGEARQGRTYLQGMAGRCEVWSGGVGSGMVRSGAAGQGGDELITGCGTVG